MAMITITYLPKGSWRAESVMFTSESDAQRFIDHSDEHNLTVFGVYGMRSA